MANKPKILVLYFTKPTRVAVLDLLFCYKRYAHATCYYYSALRGELPSYLLSIKFDLIIFHTIFISQRWIGDKKFKDSVYPIINKLKNSSAVKILLPQDEWIHTVTMNDLINDFQINIVYTVAPETEIKKIYNKVDFKEVKFYKILTGYIDDATVERIERLEAKKIQRDIDIGYRAYKAPMWLGSHGYLKTKIAEIFNKASSRYNLITNISTDSKDTFHGDSWYRFLMSCKYFIGVEGGATVIDPDGSIWKKGVEYEKGNPNASFSEFEEKCFPGMDGNLHLIAISPRHLEACTTKTCQILVEGRYDGILEANKHYIELKADFSNLNEVLDIVKEDKLRQEITDCAYRDIVASGYYSYRKFVGFIMATALSEKVFSKDNFNDRLYLKINIVCDSISNLRYSGEKWYVFEILRRVIYYCKIMPYTVLIKFGVSGLKEKRARINY